MRHLWLRVNPTNDGASRGELRIAAWNQTPPQDRCRRQRAKPASTGSRTSTTATLRIGSIPTYTMTNNYPWWTVFAVYDDTRERFVHHAQTADADQAWRSALGAAEGPIHRAGIVAGRVDPVPDPEENVVPIRGPEHATKVARVTVEPCEVMIPARCPRCRADTRRSGALVETSLLPRIWHAHLAPNGKDLSSERHGRAVEGKPVIEAARVSCAACEHVMWNGIREP